MIMLTADLNRITLASWDWMVIALFFAAMIWICWDVSKKKKETSGDYFLSGRTATWIAIGASIFASNIGSEHLIGLAGTGASAGMAQAHWEIQGWMILILGWVFVPFYERSMVYTMPDYLEKVVFLGNTGTEIAPTSEDIAGFSAWLEHYKACLPIEKAAVYVD